MRQSVLATGGAGYVGSHVAVALLAAGHDVVILDNFDNSRPEVIEAIGAIGPGRPRLVEGDVRDLELVRATLRRHEITAVVHLAGRKAVAESVADPLLYFDVNVGGALTLLRAMRAEGVRRFVLSSSATVYAPTEALPIAEDAPLGPTNPYGRSKLMIEQMLDAVSEADPGFAAISLRYFNPVGAHESGLIGEDPRGVPNNLFPYIAQTAAGLREAVQVYGDDYPTPDGSGVRDYVHVVDLAEGHAAALAHLVQGDNRPGGHLRLNLGTGRGASVLEAIAAFARAAGRDIPCRIAPRRPGDIAASVADPAAAAATLGWRATRNLEKMCADHWNFQKRRMEGAAQAV